MLTSRTRAMFATDWYCYRFRMPTANSRGAGGKLAQFMSNGRHKLASRRVLNALSGVRGSTQEQEGHSDMGTLRSGIVALSAFFGAAVAAVPAVADGGP